MASFTHYFNGDFPELCNKSTMVILDYIHYFNGDLPIISMVIFHSYVNVYQSVVLQISQSL
jgi:hypothetical protein